MAALVYIALRSRVEEQVGAIFWTAFARQDQEAARDECAPCRWNSLTQVADIYANVQCCDHVVSLSCREGIVQISYFKAVVKLVAARLLQHFGRHVHANHTALQLA